MDREIDPTERARRRTRRIAAGAALVLAAAGLAAASVHWLRPSIALSRVRTGVVRRGGIEATLLAAGTVIAASERVIACPAEARIERVLRRPGDVLNEGDAILALDTSEVRLDLERLEDRLAQTENDASQARLDIAETLAELESRVEGERLDLEMARYKLDQAHRLDGDGLIADESLKQAEVAVKKAEIEVRRSEEEMVAARRSHEMRLERLDLDASILRKERDDKQRLLELATTRSPVAGVLTWVAEDEGAVMTRGAVLARVADLGSFRVEATLSDTYASRLRPEQDVRVRLDERTLPGRVATVLPAVESGTVGFTVELDEPSAAGLRQNLRVDVLVVTERRTDTLIVPRGPFVQGGGDRHRVFVLRGDRAERTDVRLGLVGHESFEVLEGLNEGDEVIVSDMRDYIHARELRLR